MATKKPAPKKVAPKPAAKKPAPKPAAKKVVAKPVAKKPAPKPAAKKVVAKPAAKKPAPKPVAKKVVAKPVAKKAVAKPAAKKPAPKPVAKKVVAKPVAKKPIPKKEEKKVIETKVKKTEKEIVKPAKQKVIEVKEPKQPKVDSDSKEQKVRKPRAKKPKRIVRVPKLAKVVKAAGIEKATTVIPVKKIVPKVKDEPLKNFKVPKISAKSSVTYSPGYVPMDRRKEDDMPQAPLVRYSDAELNEFRDLISKKLEAAKKELAYLQGVITHKGEMDSSDGHHMSVEDGSMTMEREQMSNFASRQITFIDHLEKAMQRIENKTYGICRVTGKLIDKARLRAVPHATLSLEAKLGLVKPGE